MGIILCKTKVGKKPYIIKNMGQSIYSLEELSYYIYNNVYLIGPDIIGEDLVEYIKEELEEKKLAASLKILLDRKASLSELCVCILKYVDFYGMAQIESLQAIMESMNSKKTYERIKSRADNLLKNNCCHSAIKNYDIIILGDKDSELTGNFYADVHHNKGVAYAKLFMYEKAYECFMKAYDIAGNEESKHQACIAALLYKNQNGRELAPILEEDEFVANHEIETIMDNVKLSEGYAYIEKVYNLESSGEVARYYEVVEELLQKFREQYIEMSK